MPRPLFTPSDDTLVNDRWSAAIYALTGINADPYQHPPTTAGMTGYLTSIGITNFTGAELARPRYPELAAELLPDLPKENGQTVLLPARWVWPRGALIALILQRCRDSIRGPIHVAHWARPEPYNARAGGAAESDHVTATAIDVDFVSASGIHRALDTVIEPLWEANVFEMSLGVGIRRMHLGFLSPKGRRRWSYG